MSGQRGRPHMVELPNRGKADCAGFAAHRLRAGNGLDKVRLCGDDCLHHDKRAFIWPGKTSGHLHLRSGRGGLLRPTQRVSPGPEAHRDRTAHRRMVPLACRSGSWQAGTTAGASASQDRERAEAAIVEAPRTDVLRGAWVVKPGGCELYPFLRPGPVSLRGTRSKSLLLLFFRKRRKNLLFLKKRSKKTLFLVLCHYACQALRAHLIPHS